MKKETPITFRTYVLKNLSISLPINLIGGTIIPLLFAEEHSFFMYMKFYSAISFFTILMVLFSAKKAMKRYIIPRNTLSSYMENEHSQLETNHLGSLEHLGNTIVHTVSHLKKQNEEQKQIAHALIQSNHQNKTHFTNMLSSSNHIQDLISQNHVETKEIVEHIEQVSSFMNALGKEMELLHHASHQAIRSSEKIEQVTKNSEDFFLHTQDVFEHSYETFGRLQKKMIRMDENIQHVFSYIQDIQSSIAKIKLISVSASIEAGRVEVFQDVARQIHSLSERGRLVMNEIEEKMEQLLERTERNKMKIDEEYSSLEDKKKYDQIAQEEKKSHFGKEEQNMEQFQMILWKISHIKETFETPLQDSLSLQKEMEIYHEYAASILSAMLNLTTCIHAQRKNIQKIEEISYHISTHNNQLWKEGAE